MTTKLNRAFLKAAKRSRATLVPPAYDVLWKQSRFIVLYGGRSAAKSWSIARVLLTLVTAEPLRVLCCREIQGSIRESAYRLLADQITALELDDQFEIQSDAILGRNGSRFYFEGLRYNASKIRSYEGVDIVWIEEAQSVSDTSFETLLPTIRKRGSRFFISFNPMTRDDPVAKRFIDSNRPDVIAKKVSFSDNPYLSPEAEAERAWLEATDPDAYLHVWEGHPRTVSDALILRNKFEARAFDVDPTWAGPYHGLDYGFARDPSAAVRAYIDDATRTLYVTHEFWQLAADIDALPNAIESAIPGISRYPVYADAARPESTSYLARHGIPNARSAEKWPGSVDDGIAYLRSFDRIVIDPRCTHLIDECKAYSFKTDRLTGVPLPEPEDKNNHLIDALRYALSPLIRNLPTYGYFSRSALLIKGEPVATPNVPPIRIFSTLAITDRPGTSVGIIHWGLSPITGTLLTALDYDLAELDTALTPAWLAQTFDRMQTLRAQFQAADRMTRIYVEKGEFHDALTVPFAEHVMTLTDRPAYDINVIDPTQLPATLDARASDVRASINGGRDVKLHAHAYTHHTSHRGVVTNYLTSQLLGYRPNANDQPQELVAAFVLGVLIARAADRRTIEASDDQPPPSNTPPPAWPGFRLV